MWLGLGVAWGLLPHVASAQTGIGTTSPDPSAMLEIRSINKGLLIPQVALTASNAASPITAPATGLLVYNTSAASINLPGGPGYYYNAGTPGAPNWLRFISTSTPTGLLFWGVNGNSGTDANSNFLGTTDAQDLAFRTNNVQQMRLYQNGGLGLGNTSSGNLQLGFGAAGNSLTGTNNSVLGVNAGLVLNSGNDNTFFGSNAGAASQNDIRNTIIGSQSGRIQTTGSNNTYLGYNAGGNQTSGSGNVFIGKSAVTTSGTGDDNILIGNGATNTGSLTNSVAIGAAATVGQSNSIVLGNGSNVGIGTSVPSNLLHVVGKNGVSPVRFEGLNGAGSTQLVTVSSTGVLSTAPLIGGAGDFIANSNSTNNQQPNASFNISGTAVVGQKLGVGIGINPPNVTLEVGGGSHHSRPANRYGYGGYHHPQQRLECNRQCRIQQLA